MIRAALLLVALLATGAGCRRSVSPDQLGAGPSYPGTESELGFFPPQSVDPFEAAWFGNALRAMREPILHGAAMPPEWSVGRVLWLRSFHEPVSVRIVRSGQSCVVITTVLESQFVRSTSDTAAGSSIAPIGFGPLVRRDSTAADAPVCDAALGSLVQAGLGAVPVTIPDRGLDGSEWILELVDASQYRLAVRWSPDTAGALGAAALGVLRAGRVTLSPVY